MGMYKGQWTDNRMKPRRGGLDFSLAEAVYNTTEGTTLKFQGGTTMGFNHATYGGIRIVEDGMSSGDSSRGLSLILTPTLATGGIRQGGLFIQMDRYTAMTTSDGNYDIACKIFSRNRAASESYCRTRAMEVLTEVRDTGSGNYAMDGIYVAVKTRSGTNLGAGGAIALKAETNMGADCTGGEVIGINIHDVGQTATPTIYGLKITTASYAITRTYAVYIGNSGGAWTNGIYFAGTITNAFNFEENDGSQGFTAGSALTQSGNIDGYIKIYDTETGQALYIDCYDAAPA